MNAFKTGALIGLACAWGTEVRAQGQTATAALSPSEDGFTRKSDPFVSLGTAGAVHVAGINATNAQGTVQGEADSWIKFDAQTGVMEFDATFGADNWVLESATLTVEEVGAPRNQIFSRGAAMFDVVWVVDDGWAEGTGRPSSLGTATGNELSYNSSRGRLDATVDESLGRFTSAGVDGVMQLDLSLTEGFSADVIAGGDVTLVLRSADPDLGLTLHSRNWQAAGGRPQLTLTAVAVSSGGTGGDPGGGTPGDGGGGMMDPVDMGGGAGGDAGGTGGDTDGGPGTDGAGGTVDNGMNGDTGQPGQDPTGGDGEEPMTQPMCGIIGGASAMMTLAFVMFAGLAWRSPRRPRDH